MERIIIIEPNEFWAKQQEIIQRTIRDELNIDKPNKDEGEDIMVLDEVCRLLKKSKQTIYNWMDAGVIEGHYINESLFFLRSEIIALLKSGKKETKNR
jgi:hypothetical protein